MVSNPCVCLRAGMVRNLISLPRAQEQCSMYPAQEGRESQEDRAALAEAAGDVAANLAAQAGEPLSGDPASNALLKACFDGMAAPATSAGYGRVHHSAASSLGQARLLPSFHAPRTCIFTSSSEAWSLLF